jgi:Ca2+-binding EF-hand superfamily protein
MDPNILSEMINECDKNGDGVIDYNEFLEMMAKPSF